MPRPLFEGLSGHSFLEKFSYIDSHVPSGLRQDADLINRGNHCRFRSPPTGNFADELFFTDLGFSTVSLALFELTTNQV